MRSPLASLVLVTVTVAACSGNDEELSPLAQQGKRVYQNVCIACHNGNPTRDGAVGPAIAGSSVELLEARLLRGGYPPGYKPKRPGEIMPRFEYLADQIPALAAYLAESGHAAAAGSGASDSPRSGSPPG